MIAVKIGASARDFSNLDEVEESWITRQISGLQRDQYPVCVRVKVNEGGLNMTLATADCDASGGGGRLPNAQEAKPSRSGRNLGSANPGSVAETSWLFLNSYVGSSAE